MEINYNSWINPNFIFRYAGGAYSSNLAGITGYDYFLNPAIANDAIYFGNMPRFDDIQININTALAASNLQGFWEYYNGSSWQLLSVIDHSNGFTITGQHIVAFVPPDDWSSVLVNNQNLFWIRYRINIISGQTARAANLMAADKVGENVIVVTGYSVSSPCTYDLLSTTHQDVVVKLTDKSYKMRCRLRIGDGAAQSYFLKNKNEYIEWMIFNKPYTTVSLVEVLTNGYFQYGDLVDPISKIGKNGGQDIFKGYAYQLFQIKKSNTGVIKIYGSKFISLQPLGFSISNLNSGSQIFSVVLEGYSYLSLLNNVDLNDIQILHGSLRGLAYLTSCTMNDIIIDVQDGVLLPSGSYPVVITNSKFLNTNGTDKVIGKFLNYSSVSLYLIDCEVPTGVWTPSIDPGCSQRQNRQYTFDPIIVNREDKPISGANVKLRRDTEVIFEEITDSQGRITFSGEHNCPIKNAITKQRWWYDSCVKNEEFCSWSLTIEKPGYKKYEQIINIDQSISWKIGLDEYIPVNPIDIMVNTNAAFNLSIKTTPNLEVTLDV